MSEEDIWKDDLLSRKDDYHYIVKLVESRVARAKERNLPASMVLNIDSSWGGGKSFFLKRFREQLISENHSVAMVSAWEQDFSGDPMTALMSTIVKSLEGFGKKKTNQTSLASAKRNFGKIALGVGRGVAGSMAKRYIGATLEDVISDAIDGKIDDDIIESAIDGGSKKLAKIADDYAKSLIEKFEIQKTSITQFKNDLASVVSDSLSEDRLFFVIVDELDRCRPTYAVELLECVKHLFSVDRVVFVVATDTKQLTHSISALYGSQFDSRAYLNRFFDRTYQFAEPQLDKFVTLLLLDIKTDSLNFPSWNEAEIGLESLIVSYARHYCLTLRDLEQHLQMLCDVADVWPESHKLEACVALASIASFQKYNSLEQQDILDRAKGWKSTKNFYDVDRSGGRGDGKWRSLEYGKVVGNVLSLWSNLNQASKASRSDETFEQEYAYRTFVPEWSGKPMPRGVVPSVQLKVIETIMGISAFSDA